MDVLKIFLAASSGGETAVLVLDTKNKAVTFMYSSVEPVAGKPVKPSPSSRKRQNPARVRLEAFMHKKVEEKARNENQQAMDNPEVGAFSSNTTKRLVLELAKKNDTSVGTVPPSPIIDEDVVKFSFESLKMMSCTH